MGENGELSCFRGAFDWRLVMRMRHFVCLLTCQILVIPNILYCPITDFVQYGSGWRWPYEKATTTGCHGRQTRLSRQGHQGHLHLETLGKSIPQVLYEYTRVHWTSFGLWNGDPSRVCSVTLWVMQPFFPDVSSIWLCHNIMVGSLTVPGLRTKSNSGIPGDRPWPSSFARNPLQKLGLLPSPGPWTRPKRWPFRLHLEFGTRISSSIYTLYD